MTTCLNCGNGFDGAFCNACGQKASTHRFTTRHLLHEVPHTLFHLDRGVLKNTFGMLQPRRTVQGYVAGKRVGYFNPFFFWLLSIGLIIYLEDAFGKHLDFSLDLEYRGKLYDAGGVIAHYLNYYFFAFVFLYALPNQLLLGRDTGYNYAEHVVATTFVMGYANVGYLLLLPLPFVFGYPASEYYLAMVTLFSLLIYYRPGRPWTLLKILVSVFLQVLLVLAVNILIGYAYAVYRSLTD